MICQMTLFPGMTIRHHTCWHLTEMFTDIGSVFAYVGVRVRFTKTGKSLILREPSCARSFFVLFRGEGRRGWGSGWGGREGLNR